MGWGDGVIPTTHVVLLDLSFGLFVMFWGGEVIPTTLALLLTLFDDIVGKVAFYLLPICSFWFLREFYYFLHYLTGLRNWFHFYYVEDLFNYFCSRL